MEMIAKLQNCQYQDSFFHQLDPRVKIGLALTFSLIGPLIQNPLFLIVLTTIAISYMFVAGLGRTLLFMGIFFLFSMLMYVFIEALILGRDPKYQEYAILTLTMLPIMCGGLLLGMTTSLEKLVTALGRLGMPKGMRYAIMVTMRYVAMLTRELKHVVSAMKVRGVMPRWRDLVLHPVRVVRIVLIPLLVRSFKVADRMGAAAELRGLSAPDNRLELAELHFDETDTIFLLTNFVVVAMLWALSNSLI